MDELQILPNLRPLDCKKCSLHELRKNVVPSYLPSTAQILFLGESPGEVEDMQGNRPFTGSVGKVLDECIHILGYDRDDPAFAYANVVSCRPVSEEPGKKNRLPKESEIHACASFLDEEIKSLPNLKVIVCLGTTASNRILGKIGIGIGKLRDYVCYHPKYKVNVVVTYYPAAYLQSTSMQEKLHIRNAIVDDIQKAIKVSQVEKIVLTHTSYVCSDMKKVRWLFEQLNKQDLVAWDTETDALDYLEANILCHSFSWKVGTGAVLPILSQYSKPYWSEEESREIYGLVKDFLENPNIKKVAQNGKFDIQQVKAIGIEVQNFYADTMLQHYLVEENLDHGLKMLAWLFTDYGGYEEELDEVREMYAKEAGIPKKEASFNIIPNEILWKYSGMDPDVTLQIYYKLLPILEEEGTIKIFRELYMPFTRLVADMEFEGMNVDREYLVETQQKYTDRITNLEKEINKNNSVRLYIETKRKQYREERGLKWDKSKVNQKKYTREEFCNLKIEEIEFNYGSTKQLKELLIDQLKLKIGKKTEGGGPSFDKEAMEVYARKVPIAKLIAEINKASNLQTTFLDGILDRIRSDGRVHTSLNLHVASTGRLSSSNPNLENIPNKTNNPVDSKLIRDIYIADNEEHLILEFDMKQNEFRVWCQMSQDPVMMQDLANGMDIHTDIASQGFKVTKEQVTKEKRDGAKGVVFGKMYGRGNKSVAEKLNITISDAEKIEAVLFNKYKIASAWLRQVVIDARKNKYVDNLFGFRRHLKGSIDNYDSGVRAAAERQAINSPIQGGASQMVCYAMLKADKLFKEYRIRGRQLFPIHDAILFSIHKDDVKRAIPLIEESMVHPHPIINVPLGVEGKIGYRWGTTQNVEEWLKTN